MNYFVYSKDRNLKPIINKLKKFGFVLDYNDGETLHMRLLGNYKNTDLFYKYYGGYYEFIVSKNCDKYKYFNTNKAHKINNTIKYIFNYINKP